MDNLRKGFAHNDLRHATGRLSGGMDVLRLRLFRHFRCC